MLPSGARVENFIISKFQNLTKVEFLGPIT